MSRHWNLVGVRIIEHQFISSANRTVEQSPLIEITEGWLCTKKTGYPMSDSLPICRICASLP